MPIISKCAACNRRHWGKCPMTEMLALMVKAVVKLAQAADKQEGGDVSKADYVRSQPQTRDHTCHWPGCGKQVPPAMWGCKAHWFALPAGLRARIWRTYRPGQERTMDPSDDYLAAAKAVQAWIAQREGAQ